ncbi:MAG: preprotein translocase subunit YajC [Treponema sp.]
MVMNLIPLLQTSGGGQYMFFVTLGLVFLIFYFLLIRPQRKEQKEREALIATVKKGDKIITIGGLHGMVTLTKERTVIMKVDEGCKIEISRSAIATVLREKEEKTEVKEEKTADVVSDKNDEKTSNKGLFGLFGKKSKSDK